MHQVHVFRRHQTLIPFVVAMELLLRQGKMTSQEHQLLSRDLAGLEPQLDSNMQKDNAEGKEKPAWIPREVGNLTLVLCVLLTHYDTVYVHYKLQSWCQVLQLQRQVQTFRRLSLEISSNSDEWKEYFDVSTCTMVQIH